jgi:hypothetical protein
LGAVPLERQEAACPLPPLPLNFDKMVADQIEKLQKMLMGSGKVRSLTL